MEDYKKIALELGQTLIDKAPETREDVERMLPELKESEDERIRKSLKHFIEKRSVVPTKAVLDKWIAWLEKQGKLVEYYEDRLDRCACENFNKGYKAALEAAKEEKVNDANKTEPKFKAGDRVIGIVSGMQYYITEVCDDYYYTESGCTIRFYVQDNFELYKQKQEWSEEDIYALNTLSAMVANNRLLAKEEKFKLLDWLNSIKSRLYLQEWSEDDKRKIDRIYSILRQAADTHAFSTSCRLIGDKECIELQDFLKSLRHPYYCDNCKLKQSIQGWKPSDVQIECLSNAIKHYNSWGYPASKLKELLDDLKKLREE